MIPDAVPGADLVERGLRNLDERVETVEALLVSITSSCAGW
jgi:hypothetical protein